MPDVRQKDAADRKIRRCRKCTDINEPGVTAAAPGFGAIDSPVAIVGGPYAAPAWTTRNPSTATAGVSPTAGTSAPCELRSPDLLDANESTWVFVAIDRVGFVDNPLVKRLT